MKSFILLLSLVSCCLFTLKAQHTTTLAPDDFEKRLLNADLQLLDVRTSGEYQNGHLRHAFQADWTNFAEFKDRVQYLDKKQPVLIYCAVGGRSSKAAQWLRENGFDTVQELQGGITAWKISNKPVEVITPVKQMQLEEFNQLIHSGNKVLVEFGAIWCPPCRQMEPVLRQLQDELKGQFDLVRIDGGIHTNILKQLKMEALPGFIIYQSGKETWRKQGITDIKEFKTQLTK